MKLSLKISTFTASLALLAASAAGQATPIEATYNIDLSSSDPGLVLHYQDIAPNPFNFNLNPGEQVDGPLFKIWTDEDAVNDDDKTPKNVTANFNFILPEVFGGSVGGTTVGGHIDGCVFFVIPCEGGSVTWNGPTDLYFGPKGDGHLKIWLDDAAFNWGAPNTFPGEFFGATIIGHLELIADATAVPGPGGLALFALGLAGLGAFMRRKRR